jgi:septin family protein
MDSERVGLTLWDSAGLEKSIVDLQLREMTAFIESKFEETFAEEQKVMRSPGFRDTHIHCVFLVLDPLRLDANIDGALPGEGGLDDGVEVQVLRALWEKTVVIPVIAKADTLTTKHMAHLKRAVWKSIRDNSMNPLDALELEDDEEEEYGRERRPTQFFLGFTQLFCQRKAQELVQTLFTRPPLFPSRYRH